MNEQQWLTATDSWKMLDWLRQAGKFSERKSRLFAAACCRRTWPIIRGGQRCAVVEVAERYADGEATAKQLSEAARTADPDTRRLYSAFSGARTDSSRDEDAACAAYAVHTTSLPPTGDGALHFAYQAAKAAASAKAYSVCKFAAARRRTAVWYEGLQEEYGAQTKLLRDLFGNPFQAAPTAGSSLLTWNGGAVVQLARAASDERLLPSGYFDPARLAVLADALEEAGDDSALIQHLREQGTVHVRGCWAVDQLLGLL